MEDVSTLLILKDEAKQKVLSLKAANAPSSTIAPTYSTYLSLSERISSAQSLDAHAAYTLLLDSQPSSSSSSAVGVDKETFVSTIHSLSPHYPPTSTLATLFATLTPSPTLSRTQFAEFWLRLDPDNRPAEAAKLALFHALHGISLPPPSSLSLQALTANRATLKANIEALKAEHASTARILPVFLRYKDLSDEIELRSGGSGGGSGNVRSPEKLSLAMRAQVARGAGSESPELAAFDADVVCLDVYFPYFVGLYSSVALNVSVHAIGTELLLRKLLQPGHEDGVLRRTFLITRSKILSPAALLALLVQRFDASPSPELDRAHFAEHTLPGIRSKVISFLVAWIVGFPSDLDSFYDPNTYVDSTSKVRVDLSSLAPLSDTGGGDDVPTIRRLVGSFLASITSRLSEYPPPLQAEITFASELFAFKTQHADAEYTKAYDARTFSQHVPPPIVPPDLSHIGSILEISPVEMARQLTYADYQVFYSIRPSDYLAKDSDPAASVGAYSDRFNRVMSWFASLILLEEEWEARAAIMCKLIDIAHCCQAMDNFLSTQAVIVAVSMANVSRLGKLFALLPDAYVERLHELESIMDILCRYKMFRMRLKQTVAPSIPFIAPFLGDIIATEDAQDTFVVVDENGVEVDEDTVGGKGGSLQRLVNVDKLRIMAESIDVLIKIRSPYAEYAIQPIEQIQNFICGSRILSEAEGRERSLAIWPRGSSVKSNVKAIEYVDDSFDRSALVKTTYWNQREDDPLRKCPESLLSAVDMHGFFDGSGGSFDSNRVYTGEATPEPLAAPVEPPPFDLIPLLKLHPLEVARQLTLEDFDAFASVPPEAYSEFIIGDKDSGPHDEVDMLLTRFSNRHRWATSCVIGQEESPAHRAWMICFLYEVAHGCKLLYNFFSASAIVMGLQSASVERMALTWAHVPREIKEEVKPALDALVVPYHGFRAYFGALASAPPPLVPHIPIHLQVMAVEVTTEMAQATREEKREFLKPRVKELEAMSEYSYHLHRVEPILEVVDSIYVHNHANVHYAKSLLLEGDGERGGGVRVVPYVRVLGNQPL